MDFKKKWKRLFCCHFWIAYAFENGKVTQWMCSRCGEIVDCKGRHIERTKA